MSTKLSSRNQTAITAVILAGLLKLSGFTLTLDSDNQNQSRTLRTKNSEIESLNQRVGELSILEVRAYHISHVSHTMGTRGLK